MINCIIYSKFKIIPTGLKGYKYFISFMDESQDTGNAMKLNIDFDEYLRIVKKCNAYVDSREQVTFNSIKSAKKAIDALEAILLLNQLRGDQNDEYV